VTRTLSDATQNRRLAKLDGLPSLGAVVILGDMDEVDQSRNLQTVRRLFRLRETGDIDEALAHFAEDAVNLPITTDRVLRGRDEIRRFLQDTAASGTVLEASTFRFEANDAGQVAVFGRLRVRGRDGIKDMPAAWIYTLARGKVVRAEGFKSVADAEVAFSSSENGKST
jgi:ketosteroid isomerase-like protein